MTLTVGQRIDAQGAGFVGREPERAFLLSVLGAEGPLVVFIHGIGGVGKSALVEAFTAEARARGTVVLLLDSGAIEPTPRGFLAAISSATGGDLTTAADAAARLGSLGDRVVLVLDRYEVLRPIDLWLQRTFVRALQDNTRVVIAGREAPLSGWSMSMGRLFRGLSLGQPAPRRCRRSSFARRAWTATTSSGSIGSPGVIRCRSASRRRPSWQARISTTRRRP